jgi:N-acetyl-1-D-myo-inositol-2-amino-2-deoxy-alpha-D-glucopyranoside deacetylase
MLCPAVRVQCRYESGRFPLHAGLGFGERRLLAVHAHPDDETITTGGLLARCANAGVRTVLVTCTDGRYGPVNPELGLALESGGLAKVRRDELHAAARVLGIGEVVWLGHHDSGMSGAQTSLAPEAFWSRPVDLLVRQMVAVVRRFRPHAVVTYDPIGCTGHPDHVQAHRMTLLAVAAAGEACAMPEEGPAWLVRQVFYPVFPFSELERFIMDEVTAGRPHPFEGQPAADINYARPDDAVTHSVGISAVYQRKRDALYSHRTQVGPHYPQLYRSALARRDYEHFRLAWQNGTEEPLSDIFEAVTA